jgi:AcrR family transcriptional regulator
VPGRLDRCPSRRLCRWASVTGATVELHRTVGPAATHINEVARRAGVQRMTVSNHFPDETSLLAACSAHWRALHPTPELAAWRAVEDPGARLRVGLRELYAWFRETEPMTANVLRDAELLPALRPIIDGGLLGYLDQARRVLTEPLAVRGRRRPRRRAHRTGPVEVMKVVPGRIASFKIPRCWRFVDSFPMTVTGKVEKFKMRGSSVAELGLEAAAGTRAA